MGGFGPALASIGKRLGKAAKAGGDTLAGTDTGKSQSKSGDGKQSTPKDPYQAIGRKVGSIGKKVIGKVKGRKGTSTDKGDDYPSRKYNGKTAT